MLRTVIAGLKARPLRLLLSAVAIALGVAFVAGSFVLSDSVHAGVRDVVAAETRRVDASIGNGRGGPDLDDRFLENVRRVPGVAAAEGRTSVSAPLRGLDGFPRDAAAVNLPTDAALRPFDLVEGRFPGSDSEIAMARGTASGYALGQRVTVFGQDGREHSFTLVGTFDRASDSSLRGADLVLRTGALRQVRPQAAFGQIAVRATPGTSPERLVADLTRVVGGKGITVMTGDEAAAQLLSEIAPDTSLTKFLTAFAVLAMIVAAMVIANSFTILVAQRTKELALLRCVGAGKRQVFASVLTEAAVVGVLASVAGLFGGLGIAAVLQVIVGALNGGETTVHVSLATRTVVASLAVGVLVTVLAAALPARAATRVAPVEALRTPVEGKPARTGWLRAVIALALLVVGLGAAVLALSVDVEVGAALAVVAMVALLAAALTSGPLLAGPVMRALGAVCAPVLGRPAKLAALNAARNPKRTAASAAALTIGLAVVTLATTVMAGVEAGRSTGLDQQVKADFAVRSVVTTQPLPLALAETLATVPGVEAAAPRHSFSGNLGTHGSWGMTAVRGDAVGTLLRPAVLSGRLDRLGPGELAIHEQVAKETGLAVGDVVKAGSRTNPVPLRVVAVYDSLDAPGAGLGLAMVDLAQAPAIALDDHSYDSSVLVKLAAGTDADQVRPALERALSAAPLAELDSAADIKEKMSVPLRSTLNLLWALTALAVLIAFAGIANTLSLSVLERTRESALLRALGLTRGGLRATLTVESVFIALLGAGCGLLLGIGSAWLVGRVTSGGGEPVLFTLPWARLGVLLGAAIIAAPLAAVVPARRAARGSLTAAMAEQ